MYKGTNRKTGSVGFIINKKWKESAIKSFYTNLEKAIEETKGVKWRDIFGYFNAKEGIPTAHEHVVMNTYGLGQRNERGEMLIN